MKSFLAAIFLLLIFACRTQHGKEQQKYFAMLPLGDFTKEELEGVRNAVKDFLPVSFLILDAVQMPPNLQQHNRQPWMADSLLTFISSFVNDSIVKVAGFTHKDIYTLKNHNYIDRNQQLMLYDRRGIFGLSYVSGNAAIVSDHRIVSTNDSLLTNRVVKVFLHELGHTLGVKECVTADCLMSEANGTMAYLNKPAGRYCETCRKKIHRETLRLSKP